MGAETISVMGRADYHFMLAGNWEGRLIRSAMKLEYNQMRDD